MIRASVARHLSESKTTSHTHARPADSIRAVDVRVRLFRVDRASLALARGLAAAAVEWATSGLAVLARRRGRQDGLEVACALRERLRGLCGFRGGGGVDGADLILPWRRNCGRAATLAGIPIVRRFAIVK